MKVDVQHTCSFTGHRPERMNESEQEVKTWLREQIIRAISDGYTGFISGMQRGVDIWAAETLLELKDAGREVHLIAAAAFKGMERRWDASWQERYNRILTAAEEVCYICDLPGRTAFRKRNEWMVDHSSRQIAVYTGAHGGTGETVAYAGKKGIEIVFYRRSNAG